MDLFVCQHDNFQTINIGPVARVRASNWAVGPMGSVIEARRLQDLYRLRIVSLFDSLNRVESQ